MKKLSLRPSREGLVSLVYAALAFLIPYGVMLLVLRNSGFYPFGEKSLLIMDMNNQYIEFYAALRQIASGDSSIFFSWSKAMGTNFTGLFAYYLASPFSWLLLLFDDILMGIFFLTIFKIALCGWSSYLFFRTIFPIKPLPLLLFSTSYALISYNMVYSLSLMWLDAVFLLPLVLWGAERILRGKGPVPFILLLAVTIISQYYIAYMVCLFSFFFVLYRYFSGNKAERVRSPLPTAGIFAASYATALGLSLWLLLPVVFDLLNGKVGYPNYTPNTISNFPLILYTVSFLPGRYSSITNSGYPVLYGGVMTAVLCILFFFCREISFRKRIASGLMFALLLCSFWLTKADMVWHGFQYPNWFPYRYAFVYQFFAVFIAASAWKGFSQRPKKEGARTFPLWLKTSFLIALLCFVCADMLRNGQALFEGLNGQFGYKEAAQYQEFQEENRAAVEALRELDDSFYRTEKTYQRSYNDAFSLNYNGVTHYSSSFNHNIIRFTRDLGFAQSYFWNAYRGSTPVGDSLFGIKYVLSENWQLPYPEAVVSGDITVYENPTVLPLGFMIEDAADLDLSAGDYFVRQNRWLSQFSGIERDVFVPLEASGEENQFSFVAQSHEPVYAYVDVGKKNGGYIMVNQLRRIPYFDNDTTSIVLLGQFEPGETVSISLDIGGSDQNTVPTLYVYEMQSQVLQDAVQHLQTGALRNLEQKGSRIKADLTAPKTGTLFLSVPYDEGFTVLVDGQKTEYTALNSTFILLPVPEGEHTVELFFIPRGLVPGLCISLLVALGLLVVPTAKRQLLPILKQKASQKGTTQH